MEQDLRVREFHENDLEAVYALVQNSVAVSYRDVYPAEAVALFLEDHNRKRILEDALSGYCVIAEKGNEILGTGTLLEDNHLRRFYINPAHQYTGIGKLIYAEIEKRALRDRIETLRLGASLLSKRFWESVGFVVDSEEYIPVENERRLMFFWMSKNLPVVNADS